MLSACEELFIRDGVAQNVRADGRRATDYRALTVECNVSPQCNGSARVRVAHTDVMIAVKFNVVKPSPDAPQQGMLECAVDLAVGDDRPGYAASLSGALQRCLAGGRVLDLKKLCIAERQMVWCVHVDGLVLSDGGNVLDALCLAARAALFNARVPSVRAVPSESGKDGELELDVDNDVMAGDMLDLKRLPIAVTLTRIGSHYVVDATPEEESCSNGALTVAVNASGHTCGVEKSGEAALQVTAAFAMLHAAVQIGKALIQELDTILLKERSLDRRPVGFLARK